MSRPSWSTNWRRWRSGSSAPRCLEEAPRADLAAEHAEAIAQGLATGVEVVGVSTGGSIAQHLAADHPGTVRRLLLVSTACRLGPEGRRLQRQVASRLRARARRRAFAVMAAGLVAPGRGQILAGAVAWLGGPFVIRDGQGLDDMATTIEAEDGFDLAGCRARIQAPTLIVAGSDDRFYTRELFEETALLIPGSQLRILEKRGHVTVMTDRASARPFPSSCPASSCSRPRLPAPDGRA